MEVRALVGRGFSPGAYCVRPAPLSAGGPATPRSASRQWSPVAFAKLLRKAPPFHRQPGTVFTFRQALRSSSATLQPLPLRCSPKRRPFPPTARSPPASSLPAPCCTPCREQRKLRTTRDARLRHAQTTPPSSACHRKPQPGIPPPFVASPFCKVSHTVLGNPSSPPPALHPSMMWPPQHRALMKSAAR